MECIGPSTRRHRAWFDENHANIRNLIGKKCAAHLVYLHDHQCTIKKDARRGIRSTVQINLREMQDSWLSARAWWNQRLCKQEWYEKLLQKSEVGLQSHQCRLFSATKCKSNQAHIREEQDPGEVGRAFPWCTKQATFYQRPGHWTTAVSPTERVTRCYSNPGESSASHPSTIQWQTTRIWCNSYGNL